VGVGTIQVPAGALVDLKFARRRAARITECRVSVRSEQRSHGPQRSCCFTGHCGTRRNGQCNLKSSCRGVDHGAGTVIVVRRAGPGPCADLPVTVCVIGGLDSDLLRLTRHVSGGVAYMASDFGRVNRSDIPDLAESEPESPLAGGTPGRVTGQQRIHPGRRVIGVTVPV
jgi:hypothetical protein